MIVKFDHLSYSCSDNEEETVIKRFCDTRQYEVQFKERIKNVDIKAELMQHANDFHGLTMLQPTNQGSGINIPIEITSYSRVSGWARYNFSGEVIEFKTQNLTESSSFFRQLGFQEEKSGMLSLKTILDKKPYYIRLIEDNKNNPYALDVTGFSSMAWIVVKIEEYVAGLKETGLKVTKLADVTVNHRRLKVCFVIGKNGEIVELIGVNR